MEITVTMDGVADRYAAQLDRLGEGEAKVAMARALSHTGAKAKTQVIRALTEQTGLKRQVLVRAVKPSMRGQLTFVLETKGGDIALKFFGARETKKGVSAAPWNARRVYASTFLKGGLFPNRVPLSKGGGNVFQRTGKSRLPISKVKSGLYIPTEMLKGQTVAAWEQVIQSDLAPRVEHEVERMLPG
jgi:hypothetical protein